DFGHDRFDSAIAGFHFQNLRTVTEGSTGIGDPPREGIADLARAFGRMPPDSLEGVHFPGGEGAGGGGLDRGDESGISIPREVLGQWNVGPTLASQFFLKSLGSDT